MILDIGIFIFPIMLVKDIWIWPAPLQQNTHDISLNFFQIRQKVTG